MWRMNSNFKSKKLNHQQQCLLLPFFLLIASLPQFTVGKLRDSKPYWCGSQQVSIEFTGSPVVSEIRPNELRISWQNSLKDGGKCVDQYWVKYWETSKPIDYQMSPIKESFFDKLCNCV